MGGGNRYGMNTSTSACDTETLVINMPFLGRPLPFGFLWPIVINFLTYFYHLLYVIWGHGLLVWLDSRMHIRFIIWVIYEYLSLHCTSRAHTRSSCSCRRLYHGFVYLRFRDLGCSCSVGGELLLPRVVGGWVLLHPPSCFWLLVHFQLLNIGVVVGWMDDGRVLPDESAAVIEVLESI